MNTYTLQVNSNSPTKGLDNIGATCYMNAMLQCFFHIKILTNTLLKTAQNIPIQARINFPFLFSYYDVISKLASTNQGYQSITVRPELFKNVISKNPLFKGVQASDSKDLILYFMENLERELTQACNWLTAGRMRSMIAKTNDQELNMAINTFSCQHKSIVSDLFYGFKRHLMSCPEEHVFKNYELYNIFVFPIEQVYGFKNGLGGEERLTETVSATYPNNKRKQYTSNSEYGSYYNPKPSFYNGYSDRAPGYGSNNARYGGNVGGGAKSVSLEDCFEFDRQTSICDKGNEIFCNVCHANRKGTYTSEIYSSPQVMIIVLNRGKGNKYDCDVQFPDKLDITRFMEKNNSFPKKYHLNGVISHLGESGMGGHFIAQCRQFDSDRWYQFSDASVTPSENPSKGKSGTPYILFYESDSL